MFHQENNSIDTGQVDIGKRVGQNVPPGVFWRSQLSLQQPRFLKFNISVQKNALIGVYGRKGLAPTHTQVRPFLKKKMFLNLLEIKEPRKGKEMKSNPFIN